MRLSPTPQGRPGTCAILPGRGSDPEGFVTTGHVIPGWDPEVVLSVAGIREAARFIGLPTQEQVQELTEERDGLAAHLAELEDEVQSLREFEQAATYSLEHLGSKVRKKPGRKPADKQPAAA